MSGRLGLVLAWLASCAPLVLPWLVDARVERFAGVSALALAALPWVVWLGAPRRAGRAAPLADEAAAFALALPPLGAAAGLDLAQGAGAARTALLLAASLGCAALLALAARRSGCAARAARTHALAWLGLIALPPLARFALEQGGAPLLGRAPVWLRALADASPAGWLVARTADVQAPAGVPWGPFAACALVVAAAEIARPRGGAV